MRKPVFYPRNAYFLFLLCLLFGACSTEKEEQSQTLDDEAYMLGTWYTPEGEKVVFNKDLTGNSNSENLKFRVGGVNQEDFRWEFDPIGNQINLFFEGNLYTSEKNFRILSKKEKQLVLKGNGKQDQILIR